MFLFLSSCFFMTSESREILLMTLKMGRILALGNTIK